MHVKGAKTYRWIVAVNCKYFHCPFDIDAEFRLLFACSYKSVGLVIDIGVDAQRDFCLFAVLYGQPDQVLELGLRFDVELSDAGVQCLNYLRIGFAHTCIDDFRGIAACLQNAIQLSAADNVESTARIGHELEDVHIAACLNGIADHCIETAVGIADLL